MIWPSLQPALPPPCLHATRVKKGFFRRKCDSKKVQKFQCKECNAHFSQQTFKETRWHKKVREVPLLRKLLCSGVSQRRAALLLGITRKTVARKIDLLFARASVAQHSLICAQKSFAELEFDEVITYEHTKAKPLSIPLAVTKDRLIVGLGVASMPSNGLLAQMSREKYGRRADDRPLVISSVLEAVAAHCNSDCAITTDKDTRYPKYLKKALPDVKHIRVPGGRGCITGYKELKKKGFDPMFALNHSAAMIRDGLATMKRRTWTSVKKPLNLLKLLGIYVWFHNSVLIKS